MARVAKILIRNGTTAPSAGDFDVAEPAWDKTNSKLYIKNAAGTMVEIAGGGASSSSIVETQQVISQDIELSAGTNGLSVGPVEVADTYAVTVPENAIWAIV
jgi:hypothetical protein